MNRKKVVSVLVLMLIVISSCWENYPSPLDSFFEELEENLVPCQVIKYKESKLFENRNLDFFLDEINSLYNKPIYFSKLENLLIDSFGINGTAKGKASFIRYVFYYKLNNKKFEMDDFVREYSNFKPAESEKTLVDIKLLGSLLKNIDSKIGDTIIFSIPNISDTLKQISGDFELKDIEGVVVGIEKKEPDECELNKITSITYQVKFFALEQSYFQRVGFKNNLDTIWITNM